MGETEAWDSMTTIMDGLPSAQEPTDCPGCPIWLSPFWCLLCPCPHSYRTALCLQAGMGRAQHTPADGLSQAWAGLDATWLGCLCFPTGRSRRGVSEAHYVWGRINGGLKIGRDVAGSHPLQLPDRVQWGIPSCHAWSCPVLMLRALQTWSQYRGGIVVWGLWGGGCNPS